MEPQINNRNLRFRPERKRSNFYRVMLWLALILVGLWVVRDIQSGKIISPFEPTPTPTRMAESYIMEAQAYFDAGKLYDPSNEVTGADTQPINDAIDAYKAALEQDPENAQAWAELARIQTYSSSLLRNDNERRARLDEARDSANQAVELAPDESTYHAIRAFVLDWLAFNPTISSDESQSLLVVAEREASRAFQLDPENALALAYYAEILADTQRWLQAEKYAAQAVELDPTSMDTHRVYGYVLETLAQYNSAIQQYQEAARITPNMTFLYIRIGQNYREGIRNPDRALEYFDKAAKINAQLGVEDPIPYIEIAKTYTQQGQFFAAGINAEKALGFDPSNAHTYGQLGLIYRRARNYEGANLLLKCAVSGCTAEENELGGVDVQGLPLTSLSVAYYYVEYGTNLAFLSRPNENYCPEALDVLSQVRAVRSDDELLMSIVEDSEGICRKLAGNYTPGPTSTPQPAGTPEPDNMIEE
jgi:tetratricopeptide (TPR) repeat protein